MEKRPWDLSLICVVFGLLLSVAIIGSIAGVALTWDVFGSALLWRALLPVLWCGATLYCFWGLWNMQRWGLQLMVFVDVLGIPLMHFMGTPMTMSGGMITLGFFGFMFWRYWGKLEY